jgi:hypothetical protein
VSRLSLGTHTQGVPHQPAGAAETAHPYRQEVHTPTEQTTQVSAGAIVSHARPSSKQSTEIPLKYLIRKSMNQHGVHSTPFKSSRAATTIFQMRAGASRQQLTKVHSHTAQHCTPASLPQGHIPACSQGQDVSHWAGVARPSSSSQAQLGPHGTSASSQLCWSSCVLPDPVPLRHQLCRSGRGIMVSWYHGSSDARYVGKALSNAYTMFQFATCKATHSTATVKPYT